MQKLRSRRYWLNIIILVISTSVVFSYMFYYSKTCRDTEYYETVENAYTNEIFDKMSMLIWMTFLFLGIIFFIVGCTMTYRLKTYYKDFYKDFAC